MGVRALLVPGPGETAALKDSCGCLSTGTQEKCSQRAGRVAPSCPRCPLSQCQCRTCGAGLPQHTAELAGHPELVSSFLLLQKAEPLHTHSREMEVMAERSQLPPASTFSSLLVFG